MDNKAPTQEQLLEQFKQMQAEMMWSNREVGVYLGRATSTIESWRSGTYPVDVLAVKAMRFAVSYARQAKARKVKPRDFDYI